MKMLFLSLIGLFLFTLAPQSAAESPASISGSIKTKFVSQYLGRVGSIFDESPCIVTEATFFFGDWYAGIWNSNTLSGKNYGTTFGDEIDLYVGWGHSFDWIKVDLMASYYAIAQIDTVSDDLYALEAELIFPKFPIVEPYIRARYLGEVGKDSPQAGMFYFAGIRKSLPIGSKTESDKRCALNLDLSTAYAAGALHDPKGFVYGRLTAAIDIPVGKDWTMTPSVAYQVPMSGHRDHPQAFASKDEVVWGLALGCKF